ncbi:MAG: nodulation protein NfeD [Chloroflexi bacterium]|nr:nodulation protein NfeD [Chloroflexota bacterium]
MTIARILRSVAIGGALLAMIVLRGSAAGESFSQVDVRGPITPAVAEYVGRAIGDAERGDAAFVVITLDTPGGLDDSTRRIVQRILASQVPVIVYVSPGGARASSAGLFITQAAHLATMAPDTNIGSAHPVQLGAGGVTDAVLGAKMENDAAAFARTLAVTRSRNADWVERAVRESVNVSARDALEMRVIDLVATDLDDLIRQVHGRVVTLADGEILTLRSAGLTVARTEMSPFERIAQVLSDPNLAYLLLTIGMYGLIYELANPGGWFAGVAGLVAVVLALFALGTLPVNWAGVVLIAIAFALFAADILVTSGHGGLTAAGIVVLLLGSVLLFAGAPAGIAVAPEAITTVILSTTAFFTLVVAAVYRSSRRPPTFAVGGPFGARAIVRRRLDPTGTVDCGGEIWCAVGADGVRLEPGALVDIVTVHGQELVVRPVAKSEG